MYITHIYYIVSQIYFPIRKITLAFLRRKTLKFIADIAIVKLNVTKIFTQSSRIQIT